MQATSKQIGFIESLMTQVVLEPSQQLEAQRQLAAGLSKDQASAWIERLLALKKTKPASTTRYGSCYQPDSGMYQLGEEIVRVYLGQQSGKQLAKRLVADHNGEHSWEYMGQAGRFVKPDTPRLSLEEAKAFGRMTGTCCVCARRLDVPESVEAGIGPVCASRMQEGRWS